MQLEAVAQGGAALDVVVGHDLQLPGAGQKTAAAFMRMLRRQIAFLQAEGAPPINNPPDHATRLLIVVESAGARVVPRRLGIEM